MTATTQHTPGPWRVSEALRRQGHIAVQYTRDGIALGGVCQVYDPMRPGECEANAHLIAAAPDLLDAARTMTALVDGFRFESDADVFRLIDALQAVYPAAIAKAEGRS